jgi:hypothetical protein
MARGPQQQQEEFEQQLVGQLEDLTTTLEGIGCELEALVCIARRAGCAAVRRWTR